MLKIDQVYLINLDKSKDRLLNSDLQLKKLGGIFSNYKRISGIDAKTLSDDYIKSITTPYAYYYLKNSRDEHYQFDNIGAIGCALSHRKVWKDMIDNNYTNVIIFEDDFQINEKYFIMDYLNNLPTDSQIAYLSYESFSELKFIKINDYWKTTNNLHIFSAASYFLNIKLAKELYKYSSLIDCHIDYYMNFYCLSNNIPRYYSHNKLVYQNDKYESLINHGSNIKLVISQELVNPYYLIILPLIILFYIVIIYKKK
jgi:GR25 family glycosyltransferase involved in LPS biosynthesis